MLYALFGGSDAVFEIYTRSARRLLPGPSGVLRCTEEARRPLDLLPPRRWLSVQPSDLAVDKLKRKLLKKSARQGLTAAATDNQHAQESPRDLPDQQTPFVSQMCAVNLENRLESHGIL